jgi:hypothetical protein
MVKNNTDFPAHITEKATVQKSNMAVIILKHLKYSYENHILGEIIITRKLLPILLLNYFELNFLKCNYSGMKHTFQTSSDIFHLYQRKVTCRNTKWQV